ncbi:MAG: hypothetical protein L3K03_03500 [Thermoplasmata archaeon]|nr:hypothetical protein [Thermoplasmata archaeon]
MEAEVLTDTVMAFRGKSFDFLRSYSLAGTPFAVFGRTETESELKFRPPIVRLRVWVPVSWLSEGSEGGEILLTPPGQLITAKSTVEAVEVAAESDRFFESGVEFSRRRWPNGRITYVPEEFAPSLDRPEVLEMVLRD